MSTLLTAILTNHLGWVATVAPIVNSSVSNDQVITINQNQAKMSEISKFHPYNVLWAQLGDLYGSIGNPSRLAKTIVCGAHTVTINKVLSVLTYFVRCGEIQRVKSTKTLNKHEIEHLIRNKDQHRKVSVTTMNNAVNASESKQNQAKCLSRSRTCLKEIANVCHEVTAFDMTKNGSQYELEVRTTNLIPQQDIHYDPKIANHSNYNNNNNNNIDNNIDEALRGTQSDQHSSNSMIKVLVTSPDNDRFEYETASEALDFTLRKIETTIDEAEETQSHQAADREFKNDNQHEHKTRRSLWSIDTVKDGISIDKWKTIAGDDIDNVQLKCNDLRRSHSLKSKTNTVSGLRRSKTVREIKVNDWQNGNSHTFDPNHMDILIDKTLRKHQIEPLVSLVQEMDLSKSSQSTDNEYSLKPAGSVVFVLGDNEVLSGLKTPPPSPNLMASEKGASPSANSSSSSKLDEKYESSHSPSQSQSQSQSHNSQENPPNNLPVSATPASPQKTNNNIPETKKKHCTHKKHSGVKFNFEQYPQIVTNYMKNKNLDITNYDFLEKGLKLEQENAFNYGASSTSFLPMFAPEDMQEQDEQDDEDQCECCANTFRILQTPSNATELEFSNDDAIYPVPMNKPTPKKLTTVIENGNDQSDENANLNGNRLSTIKSESIQTNETANGAVDGLSQSSKCDGKNKNGDTNNTKSKECMELIMLPIPKTEIINDTKNRCRIRPGYVPSLFVGITDHFIPDMVIQVHI